jgi:hypothetical protein
MHLPQTNEGWSAFATVVCAVAALLNIVLIAFLAKYTIRQTGHLKSQTMAMTAQTEILLRENKKRELCETHTAGVAIGRMAKKAAQIIVALDSNNPGILPDGPIRPSDWPASASLLITICPSMAPLPAQLDVNAIEVDEALQTYRRINSPAERPIAAQKLRDAIREMSDTLQKITPFIPLNN